MNAPLRPALGRGGAAVCALAKSGLWVLSCGFGVAYGRLHLEDQLQTSFVVLAHRAASVPPVAEVADVSDEQSKRGDAEHGG